MRDLEKRIEFAEKRSEREDKSGEGSTSRAPERERKSRQVVINAPKEKERGMRVGRQGPFLTYPESSDLGLANDRLGRQVQGLASDIFVLDRGIRSDVDAAKNGDEGEGEEEEQVEMGQLGVIGIVWAEGKVDLCIEAEAVEARWTDAKVCTIVQ